MTKAMIYLAQGDLPGARAVIAATTKEVAPAVVAAYFGVQWDLYWALDRPLQDVLLRLGLRGFDDDEASRASVLAAVHHLHGNLAGFARLRGLRAQAVRRTARGTARTRTTSWHSTPSRWRIAGKRAEAIRGRRAIGRAPPAQQGCLLRARTTCTS